MAFRPTDLDKTEFMFMHGSHCLSAHLGSKPSFIESQMGPGT
jgi:hypothetical protein